MSVLGALVLALAVQAAEPGIPAGEPAAIAAPGVGWSGFPVLVWRQRHRGEALAPSLLAGFGGVNVEREDPATWVRERGVDFYVGHAPGRDALHLRRERKTYREMRERWLEQRDVRLLVRRPCLTDPALRAALFQQLERTLAARGGDHGLGLSLGDEVGLTPWGDPLDLCRSPTCEAAWAEWAASELPPRYAAAGSVDTDGALAALERGDSVPVGAWLARRRFHRGVVEELVAELADAVRASGSRASVGLLGGIGETAFGGLRVERLLDIVDFAEFYRVGDARELAFSLRRADQRLLATLDLGLGTGVTRWLAWDHWLRGGDGLVLWSDAGLEDDPAQAAALRETVRALRALRKRFPGRDARPRGVALLHDADSLAFAWLRDAAGDRGTWPERLAGLQAREGRRERRVEAWLRALEDAGSLPGALELKSVGPGTLERFRTLVCPELIVLDDADLEGLAGFLAAGGTLIVSGEFGTRDRLGRPRATDLAALLGRAAGGRVLVADDPRQLAEHEHERALSPLSTRTWEAGGDAADLPWLQQATALDARRTLVVALPNVYRREEFPAGPVRVPGLTVHGRGAWVSARVVWIHPQQGRVRAGPDGPTVDLRAGEAAVFELVRE